MPLYRDKRPAIVWGDTLANTLYFGYWFDESLSYSLPRAGSEQVQGSSGVEDSWDEGTDQYLEGRARYIPRVTGNTPEGFSATGWEGATGWAAFLAWARLKNVFRFCPDRSDLATYTESYLVAPITERPELEEDFTRALTMLIRSVDGSPYEGY